MAPGRTLVVVNPAAKHGETGAMLPVITELLDGAFAHDTAITSGPGDATRIAEEARGYDVVVAVGGDGTAHEVLNGLMRRPPDDRPALGLIPTGSGNDYHRTLGISNDLATAVRQLATGERRRLTVGVCNGVYFANSISMGFDAKVTAKAVEMKRTTQRAGLALYLSAMLDVLFHDFDSHRVRLRLDDAPEIAYDLTLIAVCNGPTYGGGFRIVPMARPDTARLDVCIIDALPLHSALWRFPFVIVGRHAWMRQVHFSAHERVRISSDIGLPGQIDGEVMLAETYDVRVLPAAIDAVVPRGA